ncbi:MAG: Nif3-like dinuclear metal center hexameric protein [Actinobacteria bacterium]|nr:Nif3-like dinuclear metal center hexameric protein [Actinomycetota bacterium]
MGTADRLADWVDLVHARWPPTDAAAWDSTGLQVGDPDDPVHAVLVCLDVTADTLDEAGEAGADLVLAHHPLLFRPLRRLTPETAAGRLALRAVRSGVAILAAHTNYDVAAPGTTEPVTDLLGLGRVRPLQPLGLGDSGSVKLVTFVPRDHTGAVVDALAAAGAGTIGEYERCAFSVRGTGTFRPSAGASPAVGERERVNAVDEDRLEMVVPRGEVAAAVTALADAHPYEEVAYDVYPLAEAGAADRGLGRIGSLPEPLALGEVAARLADGLPAPGLRVAGDLERRVRRVAACGGAGDALVDDALRAGADLFVTGDLRHHVTLDALTMGMAMIDAGHWATEAAALPAMRQRLAADAAGRGLRARLLASAVRTDPWAAWGQRRPGAWDVEGARDVPR